MRLVYWMNPLFFMGIWAAVATLAYVTPENVYRVLMRSEKIYSLDHLLVTLLALIVMSAFVIVGMSSVKRDAAGAQDLESKLRDVFSQRLVLQTCLGFFAFVMLAYLIWLGPTLNLSTLRGFLSGELRARQVGNQVSGITTMTQFGIALSCIATYGALFSSDDRIRRIYVYMIVALLVCAFYRSFLWSERLALIETVIPFAMVLVACLYRGQILIRLLPVIAVVLVISYFGLSEYFRSWNFYREQDIGMAYFASTRFLSYYLSSFNNFGMMLDNIDPTFEPTNSLRFIYKMPLPGFEVLNARANLVWVEFKDALAAYTNPEFNLFSGIGMVVSDFGVAGGILVLTIHGFLSGRLYALMSEGRIFGLFFYPVWIVGLMEFGRLLYWGNTRVFPAWLLLLVVAIIARSIYWRTIHARVNAA